jgi:hypothetical protein
MSSIPAGSSQTKMCNGDLPSSTGTYYWGVIADTSSSISETSESDNTQRFNSISISTDPDSDSDNDGIPDSNDDCPNTPQGDSVDANGCTEAVSELDVRLNIKGMHDCDCISDVTYDELLGNHQLRIPFAISNDGEDDIQNVGMDIYAVTGAQFTYPGGGTLVCSKSLSVEAQSVNYGSCEIVTPNIGSYTFFMFITAPEGTVIGPSDVRMDFATVHAPSQNDGDLNSETDGVNSGDGGSMTQSVLLILLVLGILGYLGYKHQDSHELSQWDSVAVSSMFDEDNEQSDDLQLREPEPAGEGLEQPNEMLGDSPDGDESTEETMAIIDDDSSSEVEDIVGDAEAAVDLNDAPPVEDPSENIIMDDVLEDSQSQESTSEENMIADEATQASLADVDSSALEQQIKLLTNLRDSGIIDDETYQNQLNTLIRGS